MTGAVVDAVADVLDAGDMIIDGGNSNWNDDVARSAVLAERGVHFVDIGTSGGVHGLERGFCLMVGGDPAVVAALAPILDTISRRASTSAPRTPGRPVIVPGENGLAALRAERGRSLREDGPQRHRVRDDGSDRRGTQPARPRRPRARSIAAATPRPRRCATPTYYRYDIDLAAVTEVWRRGSRRRRRGWSI